MYHIFKNTLDTVLGRVHSNTMKNHKEQISKEKEESMKQSKLVCDCESYCEKYKVQVPKEEENKPTTTPLKEPGLMTTIANFFSNINNKNKPIDKGSEEKPVEEKPLQEKPLQEKPLQEQPIEEEPVEEEPLQEEPLQEEPIEEEPVEEEPLQEQPIEEKPVEEKPLQEEPLKEEPIKENVLPNKKKYNKLIVKCDELY